MRAHSAVRRPFVYDLAKAQFYRNRPLFDLRGRFAVMHHKDCGRLPGVVRIVAERVPA